MSEARESQSTGAGRAAEAECLCSAIRRAAEEVGRIFTPPENVQKHFRQARVEILLGIRALIDERISQLNRSQEKGTRVVVE